MKYSLVMRTMVVVVMLLFWVSAESCSSHAGCKKDDECQNDTYCNAGQCISYGTGPRGDHNSNCSRLVVVDVFQPSLQCEWTKPPDGDPFPNHLQVLSSPMVADFDFDSDPTTIRPSIVFNTYDGTVGDSGIDTPDAGVLRIIDGNDCRLLYTVGSQLNASDSVAIGDLDGDQRPEIVAHTKDLGLNAYKYHSDTDRWELSWQGHDGSGTVVTFTIDKQAWGGPSIIDLNNDGIPEILSGGVVYNAQGLLLDSSLGFYGVYVGGSPVAADLYSDNSVELVNGNGIWKFIDNHWVKQTPYPTKLSAGYTAVADFGTYTDNPNRDNRAVLDGIPEVVVVSNGLVRIDTVQGRTVFGPIALPSSVGGGPPTIGDFDGDGRAEFAVAGSNAISVFDPDCTGTPDKAFCNSQRTDGILWSQPSQDYTSNKTGSSLFDFDGDGKVELAYADEVFVRVYRGVDGTVLFSQWHSSCTWNEYPVIADVDGDSSAELVVPSNQNCSITPGDQTNAAAYPQSHNGKPMDPLFAGLPCKTGADCVSGNCDQALCRCTDDSQCSGNGFVCDQPPPNSGTGNTCRAEWQGSINGIRVYRDSLDRWPESRLIWNQYAYSITNVEDNGAIPKTSDVLNNWQVTGLNNFHQNSLGYQQSEYAPDLTTGHGSFECVSGTMILKSKVCNRGSALIAAGVKVGFFVGKSGSNATSVCSPEATTENNLDVGACEEVSCTWPSAIKKPGNITVVVDYDHEQRECVKGNNKGIILNPQCPDTQQSSNYLLKPHNVYSDGGPIAKRLSTGACDRHLDGDVHMRSYYHVYNQYRYPRELLFYRSEEVFFDL